MARSCAALLPIAVLMAQRAAAGPCGGLGCAGDMPDADVFFERMQVPAFEVPLLGGGSYVVDPAFPHKPVVVLARRSDDLFTEFMTTDPAGVDTFFQITPKPDVDFIFLSHDNASWTAAFRNVLDARIKALGEDPAYWNSHLFYASATVQEMEAMDPTNRDPAVPSSNVIARVMRAPPFLSIQKLLLFEAAPGVVANVSRLDGLFQFTNPQDLTNHAPANPLNGSLFVYNASSLCGGPAPGDLTGQFPLILLEDVPSSCSIEQVFEYFQNSNAPGILFMGREGQEIRPVGITVTGNVVTGSYTMGTTLPYNRALANGPAAGSGGVKAVLKYHFAAGQYFGVTRDSRLLQIGSPINPYLDTVSFQGQYLQYLSNLGDRLRAPAVVVPVFEGVVGSNVTTGSTGAVRTLSNLPLALFASSLFKRLEIEIEFGCASDFECPVWDRIVTVQMTCPGQVQPLEIVRWISPYRKSAGHWVVDVSPLRPLFNSTACSVALSGFSFSPYHEPWVTSLSLRLLQGEASDLVPKAAVPLFSGGTYDVGYNNRSAVTVPIPADTVRVELYSVITGHGSDADGCCEFEAMRHTFAVNRQEFNVTFMAPLDMYGCTKNVTDGTEPNGFGAWWFGRNGWCNGNRVKPTVLDVTSVAGSSAV
eukprot:gene22081-33862_t